ncbi:MAG: type II secretion system protein [Planctomycetota bacterium]|jgi:prepilin-type N-terminal cleavage/methylation domain-containing protein
MVRRPAGFTLIELLVVIAIIALLLSILIPGLDMAKKQAKTVMCQSNLHQWGLAWATYVSDNDGYFLSGAGGSMGYWWVDKLREYYADEVIRLCPTAVKPYTEGGRAPFGAWNAAHGLGGSSVVEDYGSYGPNGWVCNPEPRATSVWGRSPIQSYWRSANVKGAGNIPLFLDAIWVDAWPRQTDEPPPYDGWLKDEVNSNEMRRFCVNRHNAAAIGVWIFLCKR